MRRKNSLILLAAGSLVLSGCNAGAGSSGDNADNETATIALTGAPLNFDFTTTAIVPRIDALRGAYNTIRHAPSVLVRPVVSGRYPSHFTPVSHRSIPAIIRKQTKEIV